MASFSMGVKNELVQLPLEDNCCIAAETLALFRMSGSMILEQGRWGALFQTKNVAIARRFLSLIRKSGLSLTTETGIQKNQKLQRRNTYQLRIHPTEETGEWFQRMGISGFGIMDEKKERSFLKKRCCRRAYLRGAFLGGGSVNRPEARYHLELVCQKAQFADFLKEVMEKFEMPAKIMERKEEFVVYLKRGDAIVTFLQIIGATEGLLNFENVRIQKEYNENITRAQNFDLANADKIADASARQINIIRALEEADLLEKLPLPLREVAMLRLHNEGESLNDLVARFSGNLSKSGLNHRIKKMEEMGKEILKKYAGNRS